MTTLDTRGVTHDPGTDWREKAACRNYEPEWWFSLDEPTRRKAIYVCVVECPVRSQCLAYALEQDERHGIWAGLDIDLHRARIRRQRDKARLAARTEQAKPRNFVTPALAAEVHRLARTGLAYRVIARELDVACSTVVKCMRLDLEAEQ